MKTFTEEQVLKCIRKAAKESNLDLGDATVTGPVVEKIHQGSASMRLNIAKSSRLNAAFAVKILELHSDSHHQEFETESRILKALGKASRPSAPPLAPVLHFADREDGLLVMDWVHGVGLKQRLIADTLFPAAQRKAFFKAGQWIAGFHAGLGCETRPAEAIVLLADIADRIADLPPHARSSFESDRIFSQCLDLLQADAARFDAVDVLWSVLHGDCTPSNLIMTRKDRAIVGLDFVQSRKQGPAMMDAALFIVRTDTLLYQGFLGTGMHRKQTLKLIKAVLTGYDSVAGSQDRQWLLWCLLLTALWRWVDQSGKAAADQNPGVLRGFVRRQKTSRCRLFCRVLLSIIAKDGNGEIA